MLFFLAGSACAFELLYLLLVAISPFPGLHLSSTPLGEQWNWTFAPSQVLRWLMSPLATITSRHEHISAILLGIALSGLLGSYVLIITRLHKEYRHGLKTRRWLFLLLGTTLIFGLTLLFQPLLLSDDVFTHIFSGRILAVYGADPLNTAPIQFAADPYLRWVITGRSSPNVTGPLWLCLAALLVTLGKTPVITLLLFKGTALCAHLLNVVLVWCILGKVAPSRRFLGTLLYAWNPLAVIELAGSGHNEGILLCLLLLATLLYVQSCARHHQYHHASHAIAALSPLAYCYSPLALKMYALLIFGLAISANLIALLLVPLLICFDLRYKHGVGKISWSVGWRTLLILLPALLVSLPFWRGATTFFAVTSAVDMQHFVYSPISLLTAPLHVFFTLAAFLLRFPLFEQPAEAADVTLRASATFIFVLIYIHLFSRVRHAPITLIAAGKRPDTDPDTIIAGLDTLLGSWGMAIFWYMLLVSGWFWPWYLLWMLWVIILQRLGIFTTAMLILSGTALFIYPFSGFSTGPMTTNQAALIFGIPLAYIIVAWARRKQRERITPNYDRRSEAAQN
jgi:hypothetical protein